MNKILSVLCVCLLIFALCACGMAVVTATSEPVASPAEEASEPVSEPTTQPTVQPTAEPEATAEPVQVTLYMGDDNAEHINPVDCQLAELSAQGIADKLTELGVFSEGVTVNDCQLSAANILSLDLGKDFARQIQSMGTSGEYIMMGSLVNSFLSAYGADGLILTVDGDTLETGHSIYDQTMIFYPD